MRTLRIVAILAALGMLETGRADVVILKDGTVLYGSVKPRETDVVFDKQAGLIPIGKGFMVDDDVRRVIFSQRQVQDVDDTKGPNRSPDQIVLTLPFVRQAANKLDGGLGPVTEVTPWNQGWERNVTFLTLQGKENVKQKVRALTPNSVQVETNRFLWTAMYQTKELGPEQVRNLLYSHPDLRDKAGVPVDPAKRLRIFRFFLQAGWYDEAEQELTQLIKDAPQAKEKIDDAKKTLEGLRAVALIEEIDRAHKAGRHQWAIRWLERFPRENATEKQLVQVRTLKSKYEVGTKALDELRNYLKSIPGRTFPAGDRAIYEEAAAAILTELTYDNLDRLDPFLKFAKQSDREAEQGKPPTYGPDQLMDFALTGWVLGKGSTEPGIKYWRARQFVRDYQKTPTTAARSQLLVSFEKQGGVRWDEVSQIISLLPPAEPEEKIDKGVMELQATMPGSRKAGANYLVQLPPEYHVGRSYPVLIVLHQGVETPKDILGRWADLAGQNGYILVAPDWGGGKRRQYSFSPDEHNVVLESLRDVVRRFNVDSDKVFLAGMGEGGTMAFDVGLSHPDLFAGVLPMGAPPRFFAAKYTSNAAYLPLYVVCGDLAGEYPKIIRKPFMEQVLSIGSQTLYVEYKGRGQEWFGEELPYMFDWMGRKKRLNAFPDLGEVSAVRETDNRFFWVGVGGIDPRHTNDIAKWSNHIVPATVRGKIGDSNQLNFSTRGFKQLTIFLGRGMVDFETPVTITINTTIRLKDRKLNPNLATLMEDFYLRGDRSRLFVVKIDFGL